MRFLNSGSLGQLLASSCLVGFLGLTAGGCARGTLGRVTESKDLPTDVAKELQDRFEVTDLSNMAPLGRAAGPSPAPAQVLVSTATSPASAQEKTGSKKARRKRGAAKSVVQKQGVPVPAASPSPSTETVVYPSRRPQKDPIWIGEKLVYEITYFNMSAGDFTLQALPFKAVDSRKVYHVRGSAVSSRVFSLFYRINDSVESFFDYEGLFSHRFHIVLDETKQARDSLELNDSRKKQTFYWNRWNHKERGYTEVKEFKPIEPFSQDSLSAMYYIRTLPLKDGDVFEVPVISEGKVWHAVVTVEGREDMRTPMGKVRCIRLRPETKYQGILKKQGDSFLWLTDDDRRVPVRLEAKVRIGTVVAKLKRFEPGNAP